ncbi:MAG: hypothetical protein PHQ35_11340 [Phycisphaerae bacterium]|nr:hypothetical protein [Phycisphaerae bacterium]
MSGVSYQRGDSELHRMECGDYGATFFSGTDAVSGTFWLFHTWSDTVFASGTIFNGATTDFDAATAPANCSIMGNFTQIELTSGSGMAYHYK